MENGGSVVSQPSPDGYEEDVITKETGTSETEPSETEMAKAETSKPEPCDAEPKRQSRRQLMAAVAVAGTAITTISHVLLPISLGC